jgi:hypothetical protein
VAKTFGKSQNLSPMRPIRRIFVSKDTISHLLKLVDLVFRQAGTVLTRLSRSSFRIDAENLSSTTAKRRKEPMTTLISKMKRLKMAQCL